LSAEVERASRIRKAVRTVGSIISSASDWR